MELSSEIKDLLREAAWKHLKENEWRGKTMVAFNDALLLMLESRCLLYHKFKPTSYVCDKLGVTSIYIAKNEQGKDAIRLGKNNRKYRRYGNYTSDILHYVMMDLGRELYPYFDDLYKTATNRLR